MRRCNKCREKKPDSDFYKFRKSSRNKGQSYNQCKECFCEMTNKRNRELLEAQKNKKTLYTWTDDHGYQLPKDTPISHNKGPWPFCGHCRVRRAENMQVHKAETQTSTFKRYGKAPIQRGVPEMLDGVPVCRDCLVGAFEGPTNAWEWALAYGDETNLDRARTEIDECRINWQEMNKHIAGMIKKNGWETDCLQPWNQTFKQRQDSRKGTHVK